ncbi:MAG: dihydroneopterin aldolase [Verrucomicrobiae bacterium]|nr:dihydroneopterin aldolase [Verrucomicrobiae bacterium]NNJ44192.1 dihydroneopterin aldolase [Akkermansiaceae bacterium]
MKRSDQIFIRGLRVSSYVGVPDEERAEAQELVINATFSPMSSPGPLEDDLARTIDYHAVAVRLDEVAGSRPRKLIETLAEDLAAMVLDEFPVTVVHLEIEKFILPNTRCVGVSITRHAAD